MIEGYCLKRSITTRSTTNFAKFIADSIVGLASINGVEGVLRPPLAELAALSGVDVMPSMFGRGDGQLHEARFAAEGVSRVIPTVINDGVRGVVTGSG